MAKRRATGRSPAAQRSSGSGSAVEIICSECYFEMMYDPGMPGDSIECPACGHVCDRPDEAQIHRITDHVRKERTGFILNFLFLMVFMVSSFAWIYLAQNPMNNPDDNPGMFWGPFGAGLVAAMLLLIMGIKYETSRWETYF